MMGACTTLPERNIVVLVGPPGSGKGTQAHLLAEVLGAAHISSGDLLRSHRARRTSLGQQAQRAMDCGALVSDELVGAMVIDELARPPASKGAVLDGFPRTLAQAEALEAALTERGDQVGAAIYLEVPTTELVWRLSGRRVCGGCGATYHITACPPRQTNICDRCGGHLNLRPDDQVGVVAQRIAVYLEHTLPVVRFYAARGRLRRVNGNRPIEQIRVELTAGTIAGEYDRSVR